jgi:pimeloyl-ACP methyl ester carboxylesterase
LKTLRVQMIKRGGVSLALWDEGGNGIPFVFQHGLCGDVEQVREAFPDVAGVRLICLECRGHGHSEIGPYADLSITRFADDVDFALSHLGVGAFAIGGISMGAAIAQRIAVVQEERMKGLVLARPAWAFEAAPKNLSPNAEVGRLMAQAQKGPAGALDEFLYGETARHLRDVAPDNLASLTKFFDRKPAPDTAELLQRISADGPGVSRSQVALLKIPALVLANDMDFIHPVALARELADALRDCVFKKITPKALDKPLYLQEFHAAVEEFVLKVKS